MDIAVSDAKAQLTELVRRAEAGEDIVLTRHGQPAVRIVPIAPPRLTPAQREAVIRDVMVQARQAIISGPSSKDIDDEMYDEHGLPK